MEPKVRSVSGSGSSSTSSSSSSYDVFINFRGKDTRNTFVGHLYRALEDRRIHVFIDSKNLRKGGDIGPELLGAIKGSKLSIAVLSERYAESKWCLLELVQILECRRANDQVIFPIFFKVKTSDVKNQTGSFEISPKKYGKETFETLLRWKEALRAVGDKSGWVFEDGADQSELVEKVVQSVWIRLNRVPLSDVKHAVGLESRVQSVLSKLSNTNSKDVQFIGICGLGGIGKTTIATAIYNRIFRNFSKSCFLDGIREKASQPNGINGLQKHILYSVCLEEMKTCNPQEGSSLIKERLGKMDILLILDDVDHRDQLDALAGDINWFGLGSWIIITTRDKSILGRIPEMNRKVHKPKELNMEESLRLFSSHAFHKDQPPNDYMRLSIDIVRTTGGLPLALEVLGSDLAMERDKEVWKSMHRILKQVPHNDVYQKLKISYDNLQDDIMKTMFLDIACFFIGYEEENVISIWEGCGYEPRYRLQVLKRKSLLRIIEPKVYMSSYTRKSKLLSMHNQICDMGRRIANNQSPIQLSNQSRLWYCDNIMKVLNGGKGNEVVGALPRSLDYILNTEIFKMIPNLRLLQVDRANLEGNFQCLPSTLRALSWCYCQLEKLPANFYHEEIVMLDLSFGDFKLAWNNWLENKLFQQLKVLKLSNCWQFSKSPDFSGFPLLERLYLDSCICLVNLHESIGQLQKLVYLNLAFCYFLQKLPDSICGLSSLEKLILNHCHSLENLPESIGDLKESLVELSLDNTGIKALPDGVGELKKLKVLDLSHCYKLVDLPRSMENMSSLRYILLNGHGKLQHMSKLPSTLIELRVVCQQSVDSRRSMDGLADMYNMKMLELLCLKHLCIKEEQFIRGVVRTSYGEFSVLEPKHPICVHYSSLTHGQDYRYICGENFMDSYEGACVPGNNKSRREIWTRLEERDEGRVRKYLIPDGVEISNSRLIMLVSMRFSDFGPIHSGLVEVVVGVNITPNFKACIHRHKDRKIIYCETRLRIQDIKLINDVPKSEVVFEDEDRDKHSFHEDVFGSYPFHEDFFFGSYRFPEYACGSNRVHKWNRDIEHLHRFNGLDWFGFQLESGDTIEILEINLEDLPHDAHDRGFCFAVTDLNLFLVKEEPPNSEMFNNQLISAIVPEQEEERTNERGTAEGDERINETGDAEGEEISIISMLLKMMTQVLLCCCSTS